MTGQLFAVPDVCKLQDPQLEKKIDDAVRGLIHTMCDPQGRVVLAQEASADREIMQASIDTLASFVGMGCGNEATW